MINIEIDGKQVSVPKGGTVMDGAKELGIYIPHFCYHKKLSIAANCRMCLVQVEKAPKPLPACATPVMEGMKVTTTSEQAITAQKGVMEFLLINHPLDCPICDQGGECQLQDLAVGYGAGQSRYTETKRTVANKNLGPLISTDMTRCIHCTRCVRFGQEIAGIMELGMTGRGEHAEIQAFVGKTVDSELSGNVIDLCPVGALVSKPFRYSARTWELSRRKSISPHCGLGSNLVVQVMHNRVMRVLPREDESINECWLSDKDRFAYEGLNSEDRLTKPMIKCDGQWKQINWQDALQFVATNLKAIKEKNGANGIGALASPHSTVEELYLLQKLMRGFGSGNIDHRLRQSDFRLDKSECGIPWLGTSIADISSLNAVLIVGSTLRKDHPLIAQRMRQAVKKGLQLNLINPIGDDLLMNVANEAIVSPSAMVSTLAEVLKVVIDAKRAAVPSGAKDIIEAVAVSDTAKSIATSLLEGEKTAIYLGNLAQHHPQYSELHQLVNFIADVLGAKFGVLGEAANSVGAYLAGAIPNSSKANDHCIAGFDASQMLATNTSQPAMLCQGYVLMNVEPEHDVHNAQQALRSLDEADFVVALSSFKGKATEYADVLLPIAPFTETSGTFVNTEGRVQTFNGVVSPLGETRPAWKVIRVLGNLLALDGFDYETSEQVRAEVIPDLNDVSAQLNNKRALTSITVASKSNGTIERIGEVPIYQADPIVRRAESLQQTNDAASPCAWMSPDLLQKLSIRPGDEVKIKQNDGEIRLLAASDEKLPADCVRLVSAHAKTSELGSMFGEILIEKL